MTLLDFYNSKDFSPFEKSCFHFIAPFEGFRSRPYRCPSGVATIGYGTTNFSPDLQCIDQFTGAKLLVRDIRSINKDFLSWSDKYDVSLSAPEKIALYSFIYNCGFSAFKNSTLATVIMIYSKTAYSFGRDSKESQDLLVQINKQFSRWIHGGGKVLPGLVSRRASEAKLFISNDDPFYNKLIGSL